MGSVDLPLHLTDHLNIFNLKMKFLILASLFVLSVVADPEAEAQHGLDLTHKTSGFVRYTNGAITPEDTDSVKAAKIQHHTLKAALTDNKKTPVISVNVMPRLNLRLKQRLKLNTTGLNTMVNTTVPLPAPTLSPVILTLQLTPLDTPPPTTPLILLDIPASTTPLLLDIPAPTTLL